MAKLDRSEFIELLQRLGAERDEDALAAARALHRAIVESGMTWDDLLVPDSDPSEADEDDEETDDVDTGDETEDDEEDDADEDEDEEGESADAVAAHGTATRDEAARTIDRLLALKDLSQDTRDELTGFKHDLAGGRLSPMDARYIAALARRLGA